MIVQEDLEILAHHKHMEQLLMDDLEIRNRPVLPGIVNFECEILRLAHLHRFRRYVQMQMIFDRIGQTRHQRHSAARAGARIVRSDVRVHRTDINRAGILRGKRGDHRILCANGSGDGQ